MRHLWQPLVLIGLVLIIGAMLALQHRANGELRCAVELFREQNREIGGLRAERLRLVKAQIPAAELEQLRADHAAVARLRGEIEALKAKVTAAEQGEHP